MRKYRYSAAENFLRPGVPVPTKFSYDGLSSKPKTANDVLTRELTVPLAYSIIISATLGTLTLVLIIVLLLLVPGLLPWWSAPAGGVLVGLVVLACRAAVCEGDRRELLFAGLLEVDPTKPTQSSARDPKPFVYVSGNPGQDQRWQESKDWLHFLREVYRTRDVTWRTWKRKTLPSGKRMNQARWTLYSERLLRARLAERTGTTTSLRLISTLREALVAYRETI